MERSFDFKGSEDSNESSPWTVYSRADVELMDPYIWDFELVKVLCIKRMDISLLRKDGYQTFFSKSFIFMKDRQFYANYDPFVMTETLQSNATKVTLFSLY